MHDEPDDELTVCEQEPDEATEFDPTPWGARQRMIPSRSFVHAARAAIAPPIPEPAPPRRPAIALPPPVTLISFAPLAPAPIDPASLSRLGALLRPYAMPLCGVAAVLLLAIAYVAKPTTHGTLPMATSLSEIHAAPQITAIVAPPPPVVTPIEPALTPKVVAEIAPAIRPVAKPVPHRWPATHQAKATSSTRAGRPRLAALDSADLSSPLGRLRPH